MPSRPLAASLAFAVVANAAAQQWTFLDGPVDCGRQAVFDWRRQRHVLLGSDGATWEIDATQRLLHRAVPGPAPPARTRGAMVYDVARERVLLFGGETPGGVLGDTWIYDGVAWTQLASLTMPPARRDAAIADDLARSRIVLFGGSTATAVAFTDTWEHDGNDWVQRSPATALTVGAATMAFDIGRSLTVLVANPEQPQAAGGTWEWDGVDWTSRLTPLRPPRSASTLAYDPVRGRCVLVGGRGNAEVWEWDGATWQNAPAAGGPARVQPAAYFDPSRGRVVMVGGTDSSLVVANGSGHLDAWEWNGTAMQPRWPDLRPPSRTGEVFVADPARGRLVLFGGLRTQTVVDETWTWDGATWSQHRPALRPPARSGAAATFDGANGLVLVAGGARPGGMLDDLWGFDGSRWFQLAAGGGPSPRHGAALAFDPARSVAVLFGGTTSGTPTAATVLDDTWEWNGAAWSQRLPSTRPPPRANAAAAFDPLRNRVLLALGSGTPDAWEWDGVQWTPLPGPGIGTMTTPSLCFDAANGRMLLTGSVANGLRAETWSFANGAWTLLETTTPLPGPRAFDPLRQRLVAHGTALAEWSATPAQVATIGAGCGAPPPSLALRTRARLGDAGFGLETRGGANRPVVFALADAAGSVPLGGGCTLHLGGTVSITWAVTTQGGVAERVVPIPATTALRGVVLFAQAAVLDPALPNGGRLTQGLQFTVGD